MRSLKNILLLLLLAACLEPFEPDVPEGTAQFLVIDGIITDQPGPYTVTISTSSDLNGQSEFVSGITDMLIESGSGESEQLLESDSGVYLTNLLQGEVGESYRLTFTYNNQVYQSAWETILSSPDITDITYEERVIETIDRDVDLRGLQFFVNSEGSENDARHYRFEWEETWQFATPSIILFRYLGNDDIDQVEGPPVDLCWKNSSSVGINLATTDNLSGNILSAHPLNFATGEDRFTIRYSLLVRQYVFSDREFSFWQNLQESNESLGSLFDSQPATLRGNLVNVNDPQEIVLGYFSASGLREERIFISEADVSEILKAPIGCLNSEILLKEELGPAYESTLLRALEDGKLFFDFIYPPNSNVPLGAVIVAPECGDCRLTGGVLERPDFWID